MAQLAASKSQDPVCGVGCALVDARGCVIALGYNRRERHAEQVALTSAWPGSVGGGVAYIWPRPACAVCAEALIAAGISRVVCRAPGPRQMPRWGESYERAYRLLCDAGVALSMVPR